MGLEVYITELDVSSSNIPGGAGARDAAVARVYGDYPRLMLADPNVKLVLTWGLTSAHCWVNQLDQRFERWPDFARQRPLPFGDDFNPTPAFWALRGALDERRG